MSKERFIGTWKLVSCEFHHENGELSYPFGRDPKGMVMYDTQGHMTTQIMRTDRLPLASGDPLKGTPEEVKSGFEGINTYYGTFEVNETEGFITHHVEASSIPNWEGTDQVRYYEFSGDTLTLRTPPLLIGSWITGVVIWKRIA